MRTINEGWKDDPELIKQNTILLGQQSVQALFNGYYFDCTMCGTQNSTQDTGKDAQGQKNLQSAVATTSKVPDII